MMSNSRMSLLAKYEILKTSDLDDLRACLSQSYCPIKIELPHPRQRMDACVRQVDLRNLSLILDCHGAAMNINAFPTRFFATQYLLNGTASFQSGRTKVTAGETHGTVICPNQPIDIGVNGNSWILGIKFDQKALEKQAEALLGDHLTKPLKFQMEMNLSSGLTAQHVRFMRFLVNELERDDSFLKSSLAVVNYEQTLINGLLLGQSSNFSEKFLASPQPIGPSCVRRIEEFLEACVSEPIDLPTLVRKFGYSASSIYRTFRDYRGYTPMEFLKEIRLKHARNCLLYSFEISNVSKVAMDSGFTHLGRFSTDYKKKFGESPSETLRKAKRQ